MMAGSLEKLSREPLVHFILLGAFLFVVFGKAGDHSTTEAGKIVITQGQLASMREGFTKTRQREPLREEWEGLIRDRVREEVFYREALALGMDKDDSVIRRRLQQKLEFVSDDVAAQAQPNDSELGAYLQAHPNSFRLAQQVTFRQVFLNPEKRGKSLSGDAAKLLASLKTMGSNADISGMGDSLMLEHQFEALSAGEASKLFGEKFAKTLSGVPLGQWYGPVESAFGEHLVFVSKRSEGRMPALADVRESVRLEWEEARRIEARDKFYGELLKRYTVTVESPEAK